MVDEPALQKQRRTMAALVERMIEIYGRHAPGVGTQLQQALASSSWADVKSHAHSLKSSSANVCATRLSALCRQLEIWGKEFAAAGDPGWSDETRGMLAGLVAAELDAALEALQQSQREHQGKAA